MSFLFGLIICRSQFIIFIFSPQTRRRTRGRRSGTTTTSPQQAWDDNDDKYSFSTNHNDITIQPRALDFDNIEKDRPHPSRQQQQKQQRRRSSTLPRDALQSLGHDKDVKATSQKSSTTTRKRKNNSTVTHQRPSKKRTNTKTMTTTTTAKGVVPPVQTTKPTHATVTTTTTANHNKIIVPDSGYGTTTTTITVPNDDNDETWRHSTCDIPPCDQRCAENMDLVPDYAQQIFQALCVRENYEYSTMAICSGSLISTKERIAVVDKLVYVLSIYQHHTSTLFLTMRILDRYHCESGGEELDSPEQYYMAAVAAWFLASKFHGKFYMCCCLIQPLSVLIS
jgi:hypothetical protein